MTTQAIIDAAVECFDLGPEDQDAVLRFGMKLEGMSEWVSVKDRLPEPQTEVLVMGDAYNEPGRGHWRRVAFWDEKWYGDDEYDLFDGYPPTHWAHLTPTPPRP